MKLINELIPDMKVLEDYAKSIGYPFDTYQEKLKVVAHYKNFGSLLN